MSKCPDGKKDTNTKRTAKPTGKQPPKSSLQPEKGTIKQQVSPLERALRLSSEQIIAQAIRDLIKRDELN